MISKDLDFKKHISSFRHKFTGRVRFDEVDMMGITHNLRYLYWLEWARVDYLASIGLKIKADSFLKDNPFIMVHTDIDYINPSRFNDDYIIHTRIKTIKTSSFVFENIVTDNSGTLLATASAVMVNINPATRESVRIPDDVRDLIKKYELHGDIK